jgi:hypothetical protein
MLESIELVARHGSKVRELIETVGASLSYLFVGRGDASIKVSYGISPYAGTDHVATSRTWFAHLPIHFY